MEMYQPYPLGISLLPMEVAQNPSQERSVFGQHFPCHPVQPTNSSMVPMYFYAYWKDHMEAIGIFTSP